SLALTKPAGSGEQREPSPVADKSLMKLLRRRPALPQRQLDTRREIERRGGASNRERVRDRCATTAGGAFHRAAGDEIHAGNSRSSRAAAVRTASIEAALRFRYRQTRPFFSVDLKTGFYQN